MPVVHDKLLGKELLHKHTAEDVTGLTSSLDDTYVNVTGDTMVGDLRFPPEGFLMSDGTNLWRVTIDTNGAIVTTPEGSSGGPASGQSIGLLLALTYS